MPASLVQTFVITSLPILGECRSRGRGLDSGLEERCRGERHRKSFGGEMSVVVIFHTGKRYDFVGSAQLKVETQNEEVW